MAKKESRGRGDKLEWRADNSVKFVNPYNFVRLGDGVKRSSGMPEDENLLTGVLSCTLVAKTPMTLPDVSGLSKGELEGSLHKGLNAPVPFMRVRDSAGALHPVIPGSEIRGVIRSAFEAVDNGCLSVNNSNVASARHPFPRNPGMLVFDGETGKWVLYKAKKRMRKDDTKLNPGDRVRTWKKAPNNWGETVFRKLDEVVDAANLDQAVEDYFISLELYCANDPQFAQYANNRSLRGEELWSTVQKPHVGGEDAEWPVFYEIVDAVSSDNQLVYLSPAQLSRSVFRNRVDDLLGGDSPTSYKHCSDPGNVCEPCLLFGLVGEGGALASRLRFTDALMDLGSSPGFRSVTLKELSGPKTSAVEFYTERPEGALTWTYDYKTTSYRKTSDKGKKSRPEPERELLEGADKVKVRGRKFYLHHYYDGSDTDIDNAVLAACSTEEKTERNMTVEVALSGSKFGFEVYFDGITKTQLDKLIWTLCIGENSMDSLQMHKVGHGKPLGLGSAKVVVDCVTLRGFDGSYAISKDCDVKLRTADELFGSGNLVVRDYLVITNYALTKGMSVSYPVADANPFGGSKVKQNARASHQWFIANRVYGPESKNDFMHDVAYTLPHLPETASGGSVLLLPKFTKDSNERLSRQDVSRPAKKQVFSAPKEDGVEALSSFQKALLRAEKAKEQASNTGNTSSASNAGNTGGKKKKKKKKKR